MLQGDPSPPPDPRLAIAGYTTGNYAIKTVGPVAKTKVRIAPYVAKPYSFDARISCGPGPATQVVVTGFDPLTSDSQLRGFFSTYGEVEFVRNQVHPDNGSPLGICLVKFRDIVPTRGTAGVKASTSAKRAEKEGSNTRLGQHTIKVHSDREGRRCAKLVDLAVQQTRKAEEKLRAKLAAKSASAASPATPGHFDLPANVPKGPSGKGTRPPIPIAREPLTRKAALSYLIEREPIKPTLKRKPYLFIAHAYVPVLSTTIEHLKKRLKNFRWSAVRCDQTGYYVLFEESKRGEEETVRCYRECHMQALFTYVMNMECNQYGDPDYERSPSPERAMADKKRKAVEEQIAQEEADDLEWEKKQRADSLDPVVAALEVLKQDLQEKLLSDIKQRIAAPKILELLDPELHVEKRRRLNVSAPPKKDDGVRPPALLAPVVDPFGAGTPRSRNAGFGGRNGRRPLGPYDNNRQRGKKAHKPVNAFADERRGAPKPRAARGLHRQMIEMFEPDESDDERRSELTRGTEEQESRPISRAPSTDGEEEEEESSRAHRAKRRRIETGWGEDSDEEMDDSHARSLLAHCIHKDPENMAEKELEQVLAILPRSSPIWKKADKALKGFRRLRKIEQEADAIFGVETSPVDKLEPEVVITQDEEALKPIETTELPETLKSLKKKAAAAAAKPKKKTKKQLEEEAKAAKVEVAEVAPSIDGELAEAKEEIPVAEVIVTEETPEEDDRTSVNWGVSSTEPRKTVEDDLSVVMDIDGWQHMLKDEEDLRHLKAAMESVAAAKIGDAQTWAWKQKSIKHLNRNGEEGVSRTETKIEGYYVPNTTGSARTEGVKKIREAEKSKYLPHRIRVQRAREERQRQAKQEGERGVVSVEGFKFTTGANKASTANSRANRANNRRMVNDINISKNMSGAEGDALRFNQLKKRKKLVKFDRSAIHNWGLYAQESIAANDMIIEYVGEKVRQRVADLREAKYDMQGVGSSYLFRIDEDTVIDATKMGGIARFINHSCTPNCTAKIIRVDNTKRIVIYALRDISQGKPYVIIRGGFHANTYNRRGTYLRLQVRARDGPDGPHSLSLRLHWLQGLSQLSPFLPRRPTHLLRLDIFHHPCPP